MIRHQYGISPLVPQTSFRGETTSPNVACFLKLRRRWPSVVVILDAFQRETAQSIQNQRNRAHQEQLQPQLLQLARSAIPGNLSYKCCGRDSPLKHCSLAKNVWVCWQLEILPPSYSLNEAMVAGWNTKDVDRMRCEWFQLIVYWGKPLLLVRMSWYSHSIVR